MPVRNLLPRNSRSERGSSSTADSTEAAPAPAVPSTPPTAPPAPGVYQRHYLTPQQLASLPRMPVASGASSTTEERLLHASAVEYFNSPAAERGQRFWNSPQPSPRIAGGAAAREDAASSAFGRSRAPSGSTPPRGARRSTNPFRRAMTQDTAVSPRGLAVQRESQGRVNSHGRVLLSSRPASDDDNIYHNNTQHYIDPAILAQIPAELTPNVPQEHAGAPLVSQLQETGERHFGQRQLVPVSRRLTESSSTQYYVDPEILASLPRELTANVPASLASRPVGSSRQPGDGQLSPRQLILLRTFSDPSDTSDNYQGAVHGQQLPEDTASDNDTTSAANDWSLVRMPFGSSSSAQATRSGNSEGWVTSSNLSRQQSEVVTRPAINQAGRSLANDNAGLGIAFAGAGTVLGSGSSVEYGRADSIADVSGHHHPGLSPFPVFQAHDQPRGSAGDSQTEASEPQWYAEDYFSRYQRYAGPQRLGRMHRGREQAQDVGFLAPPPPPLPNRRRSRNNPFLASSGTYGDTPITSPYASQAYQHPSPMPTDHRHPFTSTPPSLRPQQPAQPTTGFPRAHVMQSPGLSELESVSPPLAGQSERPWARQSNVAVRRSPELDDGPTIFSPTPVRPRTLRISAVVGRSPADEGLVSPMTPSGTVPSLPSTAGPWVSNYGLRSSLEIPSRLDAVSEASSASPRGDVVGEGWSEIFSSSTRRGPSRGLPTRRSAGSPSPRRSERQDEEEEDGADSSRWSYDWEGDRVPTLSGSMHGESVQGEGPSTREGEATSPTSRTLRHVGPLGRTPRATLQLLHQHSPPRDTTQTVRERPSPRDMRGLRSYLDSRRQVSSAGTRQANTVAAMIQSSSPTRALPRAGSPVPVVPVEWTDIPLTDGPPVLRAAPPHSQPLSAPALIRQRRVSLFCLVLCHLCPPLLFLYAAGRLDWVVNWWTSGEIPSMRREDKKLALLLGFGVCGVVVLAITVGLVAAYARH